MYPDVHWCVGTKASTLSSSSAVTFGPGEPCVVTSIRNAGSKTSRVARVSRSTMPVSQSPFQIASCNDSFTSWAPLPMVRSREISYSMLSSPRISTSKIRDGRFLPRPTNLLALRRLIANPLTVIRFPGKSTRKEFGSIPLFPMRR